VRVMGSRRPQHADGHRAPLSYHAGLLLDPHRMDAFERAIRIRVHPGDVVLDLGCGTGILAMLAARRGARVHAVETMEVAELARALVHANRLDDRVTVHHADIRTLPPIEPVDLVISDYLGAFLVDDLMLPAVEAAARWLKPGGAFCPSHVQLSLAPADVAVRELEVWQAPFYGVDLSAAYLPSLGQAHRVDVGPAVLLAPGAAYHAHAPPAPLGRCDHTLRFAIARAGVLRGLLGWFDATLAPSVVLSTAPGIQTHWGQYLFPIAPVGVAAGDTLEVRLALDEPAGDLAWHWSGTVHRGSTRLADFDHRDDARWLTASAAPPVRPAPEPAATPGALDKSSSD
jgi:SAM-dependent methyltransferase